MGFSFSLFQKFKLYKIYFYRETAAGGCSLKKYDQIFQISQLRNSPLKVSAIVFLSIDVLMRSLLRESHEDEETISIYAI